MMLLDIGSDFADAITLIFETCNKELHAALTTHIPSPLPEYRAFDWRFDIQMDSRSVRRQVQPVVLLNFTTVDSQPKSVLLISKPATLNSITQELEKALREVRSRQYRKIAVSRIA